MSETANIDTAEKRYLLGSLSEDEKTRMEEAFLADDSKFEAIEIAEDELIDAYVRNELGPEERRQFQARFLTSPRLVERLNFATVLAEKADSFLSPEAEGSIEHAPSLSSPAAKPTARWWGGFFGKQPALGMAMAACMILILVASIVLVFGWLHLRRQSEQLASDRTALQRQKEESDKQSGEQRTRTEQLNAELQREKNQRAEDQKLIEDLQRGQKRETPAQSILGTVTHILLTPGSLRGSGGRPELVLGTDTLTVQLKLALENNEYRSYNAMLTTANGDEVYRQNRLLPRKSRSGPLLTLSIPARRLSPGDYIVNVNGVTSSGAVEPVSDYAFRITAKTK